MNASEWAQWIVRNGLEVMLQSVINDAAAATRKELADAVEAEIKRLKERAEKAEAEVARLRPFEAAIKDRHNGYDPEARAAMAPFCKEPATPQQAIDELIQEAGEPLEKELEAAQRIAVEDVKEIARMRAEVERLRGYLDWALRELRLHTQEYHHKTDMQQLDRINEALETKP